MSPSTVKAELIGGPRPDTIIDVVVKDGHVPLMLPMYGGKVRYLLDERTAGKVKIVSTPVETGQAESSRGCRYRYDETSPIEAEIGAEVARARDEHELPRPKPGGRIIGTPDMVRRELTRRALMLKAMAR